MLYVLVVSSIDVGLVEHHFPLHQNLRTLTARIIAFYAREAADMQESAGK
jgi:hypothetical protein